MISKSDTNDVSAQTPSDPQGQASSENRPYLSHAEVIHRLIRGSSASADTLPASAPPKLAPEKAASTAFCRAAEMLYNLPSYPQSSDFKSVSLAELSELLPEQSLLAVIEGGNEDLGVVALCPTTVSSLIEMQAVGRISSHPTRLRKPTRTDAIITADFVTALLKELGKELENFPDLPKYSDFSYASFMDDPRPMLLMLEDRPLSFLSMGFRLGINRQKNGQVIIALPFEKELTLKARISEIPAPDDHSLKKQQESAGPVNLRQVINPEKRQSLAAPVSQAPVQLIGVLGRKMMTLSALKRLSSGDLIPLPSGALDHACIETMAGQILDHGRLGESDNYHAICLHGHTDSAETDSFPHASTDRALQNSTDLQHTKQELEEIDLSQPDDFRTWPQPDDLLDVESSDTETQASDRPMLSSQA